MGLTVTPVKVFTVGDRKEAHYDVTFDSSYPAGGESLTAADLGLEGELNFVHPAVAVKSDGSKAVFVAYDHANHKLQAFAAPGSPDGAKQSVELTDTTSLANYTTRLRAVGKGLVSA